ncbi:hypothetical protein FIV42_16075 [Persicimonas caeni]|uniref:Uncharacterized protein n=1 Tax=Persicimonas caeni TaxID=2292766 RepID=A0A4Y6PVD2_PERCE|nr:hypothetical protein [Persicimonas caeni]QDG52203.1 hypothetical protein FIV42_16075 [Persicimonas caeni]QED33425.1 hypothetical protein FRD00_16070 [Persicimonas caeni]
MRHLHTVTETFQITGVGLAVARYSLDELEAEGIEFGQRFEVKVHTPDGAVWRTQAVVPVQFVDPAPERHVRCYSLFLPTATPEQVPVGSEIFVRLN